MSSSVISANGEAWNGSCAFAMTISKIRVSCSFARFTRKRTVGDIVEELKELKDRYRIKRFEFWDEMFALGTGWLSEFCEQYGSEIGLPYTAFVRAETCTIDNLRMLKGSGAQILAMGVEAGNEEYRRRHLKKRTTDRILIEEA